MYKCAAELESQAPPKKSGGQSGTWCGNLAKLQSSLKVLVHFTGEKPQRIFKDFWRSAKTCKRSLKMRIFQRSLKDIWKIFTWQKLVLRSSRKQWGSCEDLARILVTIRFTVLVRTLQDPQKFFEDLSRILKGSCKWSSKDLYERSLKMQLRSLKDHIFQLLLKLRKIKSFFAIYVFMEPKRASTRMKTDKENKNVHGF